MSSCCPGCGGSFKGSRGVAIHRGRTGCGNTSSFDRFSYSSTPSFPFWSDFSSSRITDNSINCDSCGKQCKGQHGLSIHKAKSECGSSRSSYASSTYSNQSFNLVNCDNCGKECKGQHGLAIHKAKSDCGSSGSSYASSPYSNQSFNLVNCDNCGKECKGQHGLAIHKAKSDCGSSGSSYASSTYSDRSINWVECNNCGKQCKGQHGLAIHKAKSECGSSKSSNDVRNDKAAFFPNLAENSELCDNCGENFKGIKGLMIHRAKSRCGKIIQQQIKNSTEICRRWLNSLKTEDLFISHYDSSIYDPGETSHFLQENIPVEIVKDVSEKPESVYWPETDLILNNETDKEEEKFYQDIINETIQNFDDWRMNLKTFKDRLLPAFNKELYFDAKFIVTYENEQDTVIKGHKLIFALASPVFRAMFYGSLPENDNVTIKDISPRAMQNVLLYFYTNSIILNNIDDAINTHYAAKKYGIDKLQHRSVKYMVNNITCENTFEILEYSELMGLTELEKKCHRMMNENPEKCLHSEYFLNMNLDSVMKIAAWYMERKFQQSLLAEKLVKWSMAECKIQEADKSEENLNSLLEPILDKFGSESFTTLIGNLVRKFAD